MKKVLLLVFTVILLSGCGSKDNKEKDKPVDDNKEKVSIMSYKDYKEIDMNNINSIIVYKYTVAGMSSEEVTDTDSIEKIYNVLKVLKVGDKTEMSCEDNTTIYKFVMKDGKEYSIEIECDWFVIGREHYKIAR